MGKLLVQGYGHCLGDKVYTNEDMKQFVETSDEWIVSRTGIKQRHFAESMTNVMMATEAVTMALSKSILSKDMIDGIIVATMTPDTAMPSMAHQLKAALNIQNDKLLAFDVNTACSGFIVALQVADALITTGQCKHICVVGSEKMSSILDFNDRGTCVLFGDGAGAVIVSQDDSSEFNWVHFSNSESDTQQVLITDPTQNHKILMQGQAVFRFAIKAMSDAIEQVCEEANITPDAIDYFIPHQANVRILDHVASKMNLDKSKFITNVDHVGNTSAASIPIALSEAMEHQRIKPNSLVCFVGFGGGLSWGATLGKV